MHSHHSHSGDYVSHATDTLESITTKATAMGFHTYCLTEHMPRLHSKHLYPEEEEKNYTIRNLAENYANFHKHSQAIRTRSLSSPTKFLVGFEVEGIDLEHVEYAQKLREQYPVDMVVGSVHYVSSIPIDFDLKMWKEARAANGGSTRKLYKAYFDLQYEILVRLKPEVVGHFDLIRLLTPGEEFDTETEKLLKDISLERDWPDVWEAVLRNIDFIVFYGGLVEFNASAIRKGWATPYPQEDITRAIIDAGGHFCLSDDAHAVSQVGLNYKVVLNYIDTVGMKNVKYLDLTPEGKVVTKEVSLEVMKKSRFWEQYD
ncbi:hypothetical protein BABINDRAFT_41297 [Babjeviella inositovora NRRL Y-12698]|uniref:Histidinol-phosphatase n=1 Tax=Babjeviella inositovora NRRL Y-12698 TaxID=984486 RepID=A0A1E3QKL8_9ASCO|nr:uncharacterized protein BABINDRAFT_41297 [Babjeviella inositovora NRRL Y-12698]ODQ77632.1 hypothetical protein BABINDRAFT_41297 [Babjeviella inositovora NRRL Y-12698]